MVRAAHLSSRLGLSDATDANRLDALLARFGLPTTMPAGLAPDALLARMHLDKKAAAGRLRFVLWRGAGRAEVVSDVPEDAVLSVL